MEKSRLQNRHLKYACRENFVAYKKCSESQKQSKKKYIKEISNKETEINKSFCNRIKPFITITQANENVTIDLEKNEQIDVRGLREKVDRRTKKG